MLNAPRLLCFALASVAQFGLSAEAGAQDLASRVDRLFKSFEVRRRGAAQVAVRKDGKLVLERAYGKAQLEFDVDADEKTAFHVASVSKQYTAFAICLLEKDGKLELDDPVRKHLPELPDCMQAVTLRQLCTHTSGVRDQWELLVLAGFRLDDVITKKDILGLLLRQRALNFKPGTRYLYSNAGYSLLALVVERVSGKSFRDFLAERIFRPLGMKRSQVHDDHEALVKNRAYSYKRSGRVVVKSVLSYANQGATSLFSTAGDLCLFLDNLGTGEVGGADLVRRFRQKGRLASGQELSYGLGLGFGKILGHDWIGHAGADAGFRSQVLWVPEQRLSIAVCTSFAQSSAPALAWRVASLFLDKKSPSKSRKDSPKTAPSSAEKAPTKSAPGAKNEAQNEAKKASPRLELRSFAGHYECPELDRRFWLRLRDGELFFEHPRHGSIRLRRRGDLAFRGTAWWCQSLEFERGDKAGIRGFRLNGSRVLRLWFRRLPN